MPEAPCIAAKLKSELAKNMQALREAEVVLVLACGLGVQSFKGNDRLGLEVLPALNTVFGAVMDAQGDFYEKCSLCGECIAACPTDTIAGRRGYALHLGGRIGRHPKLGERFGGLVPGMDELFRAFHALLALYRAKGRRSERFGAMLDRLDRASIESLVEGALRGASTGSAA